MASLILFFRMVKPYGYIAAWRIARFAGREVA